ncbi:SWIM zinc finger family protein [Vibrio penaeicida]|uniref:SWIM zinc finger family protein n=1 Tax=Vibrio penaeicida TaxID=104609 RepID=UPI002735F6F8|nr:SWIM zinc finger family protein [Vibrio penaeicida]MDP2574116.1 SWIM zinc finger family protein [Vibrio penaeicida]
MNRKIANSIELSDLIPLCETSTLQKGIKLSQKGAVRKIKVTGDKASAMVKGTYDYHVSLDVSDSIWAGCDCPAAQYQRLCKHAVALAISLQDHEEAQSAVSERSLIKAHLQSLGEEAVLEQLLDYLEEDERAWQTLLTRISLHQSPASYGELKKRITQALPREQIWDWRASSGYFMAAEESLSIPCKR